MALKSKNSITDVGNSFCVVLCNVYKQLVGGVGVRQVNEPHAIEQPFKSKTIKLKYAKSSFEGQKAFLFQIC